MLYGAHYLLQNKKEKRTTWLKNALFMKVPFCLDILHLLFCFLQLVRKCFKVTYNENTGLLVH